MHHGLRVIAPETIESRPWANGLGATRVIMEWPAWRISIAEITGLMPFSVFAGMDRTLIPLSPGGIVLDIAGERHLVPARTPIRFRGEDPATGIVDGHTATVLNFMVQRSLSSLRCDLVHEPAVLTEGAAAIVVLSPQLSLDGVKLTPGTVVMPTVGAPEALTFETDSETAPIFALLR